MIRPANVDKDNHTADFSCDKHGGIAVGVNVNTQCSYSADNETIVVLGSLLTPPCDCITGHPTVGGGELSQALAEAKTA
jgi:hypothetical protein